MESPIRSPPVYTLQSTLTCGVWSVDGSRDVSVDTLRVEVGKVLHSTCCVFPVHPRLTYESHSCRRGLGVRCCVRNFLVSMVAGRLLCGRFCLVRRRLGYVLGYGCVLCSGGRWVGFGVLHCRYSTPRTQYSRAPHKVEYSQSSKTQNNRGWHMMVPPPIIHPNRRKDFGST